MRRAAEAAGTDGDLRTGGPFFMGAFARRHPRADALAGLHFPNTKEPAAVSTGAQARV